MRRADNLTTFMCRLSWNLGASNSWSPLGLFRGYFTFTSVPYSSSRQCFIFLSLHRSPLVVPLLHQRSILCCHHYAVPFCVIIIITITPTPHVHVSTLLRIMFDKYATVAYWYVVIPKTCDNPESQPRTHWNFTSDTSYFEVLKEMQVVIGSHCYFLTLQSWLLCARTCSEPWIFSEDRIPAGSAVIERLVGRLGVGYRLYRNRGTQVCHSRNWLLKTSTLLVNGFWWGQ